MVEAVFRLIVEMIGFWGLAIVIGLALYGAVTVYYDFRRAPLERITRGGKAYW